MRCHQVTCIMDDPALNYFNGKLANQCKIFETENQNIHWKTKN